MLAPSPVVDDVMLDGREAQFAKRSIEREARCAAIDIALRCTDLTTPGADFVKTSTEKS